MLNCKIIYQYNLAIYIYEKHMLIKVNGETIALKSKIKCYIKTLKFKSHEIDILKIQNIFVLSERKVESKSPFQFIKPKCGM